MLYPIEKKEKRTVRRKCAVRFLFGGKGLRILKYEISSKWAGSTIESFLRGEHGISSRILTQLKKSPTGIMRNGVHARTVDRLCLGDILRLELPEEEAPVLVPSDIPVEVVYEDEDILIFDKPAGMPCHPAKRYQQDTLANVFAAHARKNGEAVVFRPVNRLDRNTTGLVIAAKNPYAASVLGEQVRHHGEMTKEYLAIAQGIFPPALRQGRIEAPIRRLNERSTIRVVASEGEGQYAVTDYRVIAQGSNAAMVAVRLGTGRTHQIRVHFSYIGHPLLGDDLYGGEQSLAQFQMLRCYRIQLKHPVTGCLLSFVKPYEKELWRVAQAAGIALGGLEQGLQDLSFTESTDSLPNLFIESPPFL